jgi:hypothetical protein
MNLKMIVMIMKSASPDMIGKIGMVVATNTHFLEGRPWRMCKVRIGDVISDWIPWDNIELLRH